MRAWGYSDIGRVRKANQDAYYFDVFAGDSCAVCIVCDGMGGAAAGNVASRLAVSTFEEMVRDRISPSIGITELDELLLESVMRANSTVHGHAAKDKNLLGMGTTLVGAVATNRHIVAVNVGDSRAYLISGEGIERVTRDHSLVEDMVSMGEITREQAREHPGKNLITRAVGTDEKVTPDIYHITPAPGSFLLLCTDGLTNLVTDQELLYEILYGGDPAGCCRRLVGIANDRGGFDNITAVLLAL